YVSVGGIRSTGLSSALGLAQEVARLVAGDWQAPTEVDWPAAPCLAEDRARPWAAPGNGGIVCHCGLATRRASEAALAGPPPARSLAGLKRRTRVTMGRCQGFYCLGVLAGITAGRLAPGLEIAPEAADAD